MTLTLNDTIELLKAILEECGIEWYRVDNQFDSSL